MPLIYWHLQRDQIKRNEQEIDRHKREKREMQNQIDRYREGGDNYSSNMRQQIHRMRQEKAAWLAEAQELRIKDAENKVCWIRIREVFNSWDNNRTYLRRSLRGWQPLRLSAYTSFLQDTELIKCRIFELENEKKESAVKVLLIKDYEKQIELLRKAESVWYAASYVFLSEHSQRYKRHSDHLKLKRQADIIEQSRSKLFTMQQTIDSEQNANSYLAERNRYAYLFADHGAPNLS